MQIIKVSGDTVDNKHFCFTIDDNIRFLKEIAEGDYASLFDHPYTAMIKRLHERFDLKIQLNMFYRMDGFDLSMMPDTYRNEWAKNANWLKLSFHSDYENEKPYEFAEYAEVYADCRRVNEQIRRFAGEASLAKTTTVHYCLTTPEGLAALVDNGTSGLLGLYGTRETPLTSYSVPAAVAERIRDGAIVVHGGVAMAAIDVIVNTVSRDTLLPTLTCLIKREQVRLMIHEQYFYQDYPAYQADFEDKLADAFSWLRTQGFTSVFFEECI